MNHLSEIESQSFTYKYEPFFFNKHKAKKNNNIFLSIADFVTSYTNKLSKEEKMVNELIEHTSWNLVGTMVENGYQLKKSQLNKINNTYAHAIEKKDTFIKDVAILIDHKLPFTQESVHKFFFNSYSQIYLNRYMAYHEELKYTSEDIMKKQYHHNEFKNENTRYDSDHMPARSCNTVLKKLYEYLDNPITKRALFANWFELILTDKKFNDISLIRSYNIFKHDLIPTLSLQQYNQLILCVDKYPSSEDKYFILADLNKNIKDLYYNKIENVLINIKKVDITKNHNLDIPVAEVISANNIVEIPENAQDILKSITNNYKILTQEQNNLIDCWEEIEIVMNKHVPLIIKKYCSISPNYRENLNNGENKNAQEILIASLSNINQCFEEKVEQCNQNKLHDLSASHKYTKHLIKHPK